jgi:hypothetical protein
MACNFRSDCGSLALVPITKGWRAELNKGTRLDSSLEFLFLLYPEFAFELAPTGPELGRREYLRVGLACRACDASKVWLQVMEYMHE